jgi:hypothetical protein
VLGCQDSLRLNKSMISAPVFGPRVQRTFLNRHSPFEISHTAFIITLVCDIVYTRKLK